MSTFTKKKKHVVNMAANQFNISWELIDSVKLWSDNPKETDENAVELAKTIDQHGLKSPCVGWKKNRVIYKGNTTWKALKYHLGYSRVPVVWHDFPSEAAAKAYGIADNKSGENQAWDYDVLFNLMSSPEMVKLEDTLGFSKEELKNFKFETDINIDNYTPTTGRKNIVIKIKVPVAQAETIKELISELLEEHFDEDLFKQMEIK